MRDKWYINDMQIPCDKPESLYKLYSEINN